MSRVDIRNSPVALLIVGAGALALSIVAGLFDRELFFRAYLVAYVFWLGIPLGCLATLMLHHLSGGAWGAVMLRILEAATRTLPLLVLLGAPLLFGLPNLFLWARPDVVAKDAALQYKSAYLNVPFFLVRTAIYLATWLTLSRLVNRWSIERDESDDPRLTLKLRQFSAVGLVFFGLTVTFAVIDWIMSLEPDWDSTIYPAMVAMSGVLSGFAFAVVVTTILARRRPLSEFTSPNLLNDLGSLLLAFVMLWAYLAYSQFLLIWSGNLPDEIQWYARRLNGGWEWVALMVALFYFVLPFGLLISRSVKRHTWTLILIGTLLVGTRLADVYWLVMPAFSPTGFTLGAIDVLAVVGLGGIWLWSFARELRSRPILSARAANLAGAAELAHERR